MTLFAKLADARRLAVHNLIRQKTRNAIMAGILALGITAYMVVVPIMDALAEKAVAQTKPLPMPCDLALVIGHVVEYHQQNLIDPGKNKLESICPTATTRPLPWNSLKGFAGVEFAGLEQAYTPGGMMDIVQGSPEASWFRKSIKMEAGNLPANATEIIVPRWFADRTGLGPGQTLTVMYSLRPLHQFREAAYTVTGIFRTDFSQVNLPLVYEPRTHQHALTDLGEYQNRGDGARLLAMFDLGGARPDIPTVRRTLLSAFAEAGQAATGGGESRYVLRMISGTTPDTPAVMARTLASDVQMPAVNALFLAFVFVAVGLFTVMLLSFLERRRDIAIMKTVGVSNNEVAAIIMAEISIVTVVGVTIGVLLSTVAVKSLSGTAWAGVLEVKWSNMIKGSSIGFIVMLLSALFPVNLARVATVNQLLYDQKIYLFHRRIMRTVKGSGRTVSR